MVGLRKGGTKYQRHGGVPSILENGQKNEVHVSLGNKIRVKKMIGRPVFSYGPAREVKRKLS